MKKESPYLEVVGEPRQMRGEGAPRSTVFGVLGMTKESPKMKSLGGLVHHSVHRKVPKGELMRPGGVKTERGITGAPAKTHIPGAHYAQIPYPGVFMAHLGHAL